jgi:superfamily II DNA/RNA helicase
VDFVHSVCGAKFADFVLLAVCRTLFVSATWPKEVQQIARQLCRHDPVRVFVGNVQVRLS